MMHRKSVQLLAVAALAALPMLASAQLTGNVALTSNYKFRGQDQDTQQRLAKTSGQAGDPGRLRLRLRRSGFYVGNWNSSVNWLTGNSIESDIYGGYKFKGGASTGTSAC